MMPWFTFQSPHNHTRARAIAEEILKLDFDILCLEKSFDGGARAVLAEALHARYPYNYGPANSGFSFKVNSGVWILSRIPLSERHDIQFRDCAGIECASRKGAMLLSGTFEGHTFQLLATHLEGEAGSHYTPERQEIRNREMTQIRDDLLTRFGKPAVPLFLCGDFDTPHRDPANSTQESSGYRFMLQTFHAQDVPGDRITFDDNCSHNDLAIDNQSRADELDYILVVPKAVNLQAVWRREILRRPGWDGRRQDLSYRYAVGASIQFR
jgi:endonuclease/exonuclease/phosphatase family metal-dependent hydrolase